MSIAKIYRQLGAPAALASERKLYNFLKDSGLKVKDIKKFLSTKDSYTLHKVSRKTFPRRKILAPAPRVIAAVDLADMRRLSRYNSGFSYILVCVDVFSRYLTAVPIKKKNAGTVIRALKTILDSPKFRSISRLHADRGGEFYNKKVQEYFERRNIKLYSTSSYEIKASIAERAIQTLKRLIYKYLTEWNTHKYIKALPLLVDTYNSSIHRGLQWFTPLHVHSLSNREQIDQLFYKMYKGGVRREKASSIDLAIGDGVRIVIKDRRSHFWKGFRQQNTREIFKIYKIDRTQFPLLYYLEDLSGEKIEGSFYREELVPTAIPQDFPVNILRKKKVNGRVKYLVHWVGYSDRCDSWIDEKEVRTL